MTRFLTAILATATLGFASVAQAADIIDLGSIPNGSNPSATGVTTPDQGEFTNIVKFALLDDYFTNGVIFEISGLDELSASLYAGTYVEGAALDSPLFSGDGVIGNTGALELTYQGDLSAGSYFFVVSGVATESLNLIGYTISAVAVPEPETYAMLLAGLGIVGMVARRRRKI
ncbi:MAG: FxDxF family PEP-CTERM protein [Azoarcus sp.]|jgi:hypothetical protein|nr:FxDxF family PEP-CTERM protein [Azoarcus sp.]